MNDETMYVFVVDTEEYAGNFEREMCAYMTGHTGECSVGEEMALLFQSEHSNPEEFDNIILEIQDINSFRRPCSVWETPGYYNDGYGNTYKEGENPQKQYLQSVKETYEKNIEARKTIKETLLKGDTFSSWTIADCDREIARLNRDYNDAKKRAAGKFPADQSVAIFFSAQPSDEQIELLKERARRFDINKTRIGEFRKGEGIPEKHIQIIGFRLLQRCVKYTTVFNVKV